MGVEMASYSNVNSIKLTDLILLQSNFLSLTFKSLAS